MTETSTPISVSELTFAIKNQLESQFLQLIVQGEVSNCKLHSSGHLYFDLKDEKAKISAVCFRIGTKNSLKEGDKIIVYGSLSVYPPHGKYQILVKKFEYAGIGELLLKLENLKKKLHAKGWFDASKKKKLPKFPKRIGVVTSPTGAVIKDIIHVLSRRLSGFHLILNPVRIQGDEAAKEIAAALNEFNTHQLVDVIIVARGGGSIEDLWPFNEEIVAQAIFDSAIPIVSAIGHETDFTIADFVADMRAPTPSAAAEIVSSEKIAHVEFLLKTEKSLHHSLLHLVRKKRAELNGLTRHPLLATPHALLSYPIQKIDEIKNRIERKMHEEILKRRYLLMGKKKETLALKPTTYVRHMKQKLFVIEKRIQNLSSTHFAIKRQKLKDLAKHLKALDPKNVLKRGYSILFAINDNSVIVSAEELVSGKQVRALLSDGDAVLEVYERSRI